MSRILDAFHSGNAWVVEYLAEAAKFDLRTQALRNDVAELIAAEVCDREPGALFFAARRVGDASRSASRAELATVFADGVVAGARAWQVRENQGRRVRG